MKQFFPVMLTASILVLASCDNNKKTDTPAEEKPATEQEAAKKVEAASVANEKKIEELQAMTPLGEEKMKALLPQEFLGAKAAETNVTSNSGANMAHAAYDLNDTAHVELSIYDCGGPGGAGLYNTQYLSMLSVAAEEDEDEYTKSIDFQGSKALEHCNKSEKACILTYFTGNRFLVTLQGDHVDIAELKKAAGGLSIK